MPSVIAADTECLHCGQSRRFVNANPGTVCGVGGDESGELVYWFASHRWRPWTDAELDREGVCPEAYERHRTTNHEALGWIGCEDTKQGHIFVSADEGAYFEVPAGSCLLCGHQPDSTTERTR